LLTGLAGVSAFDDQGSRAQPTIEFRGWTLSPVVGVAQGVSVFLDGVRINEADAQEVNFDLIPTEAIASTSLVRGPIALYGKNTLAGAVLITTKRGDDAPGVDAELSTGRFGFRQAHLVAAGATTSPVGPLDALVLARGSTESGYRVASAVDTRMLFATVGRRSHDSSQSDLALSVLYAHDRIHQPGSLPESWLDIDPRANYTAGDFFAPDLVHVALRGARSLGVAALRGNVFVRRELSQQFNVNVEAPSSRAHIDAGTVGSTIELDVPTGLAAFTIGAEASRDRVRYRVGAEATADAPTLPNECDPSGLCENARVDAHNAALFGQLVVPLGHDEPSFSLTIAARADYVRTALADLREAANDGVATFRRASPRAALSYQGAHGVTAYAAVNTAFRTPAPLELACADESAPCLLPFSLGDDPPLAPVTVLSWETGATWVPVDWLTADASLYTSRVRNEIVFAASSRTAGYFRNIPRTARRGLELALRAERRRPGTTLRAFGQYALVDATYRSTALLASALPNEPAVSPGDRLPLSPRYRAAVGVGATTTTRRLILDADLRMRGTSSQLLRGDEANTQRPLPGYAVAAANLSVRRDRFALTLDVDNLLDRRFTTFGTFAPDVLAQNPGSSTPPVTRFVTPGYPRALTLSLSAGW
jgi:outer membrane receptor protein involved in Fe transport